MSTENVIINLEHVSKTIKGKTTLHPLTYQIKQGKILALCGGNGAGKSTLIRMITGLVKPTTGKVRFKLTDYHKCRIGYMPDHFTFQPSLTAQEIIRYYGKIKRVNNHRYEEVLDKVGLLAKQDMKVGTYSKGMAQRLLLAQSLLDEPRILILDEPTNGLDPYWIEQFSQILLNGKGKGQTIIFSTHDLHIAEKVADEVIFLRDGKITSQGPIENYQTEGLHETFQKIYYRANDFID